MHATAAANTTARPRVETVFALENMSIGQATKALTGKAVAAGRMSLKARLKTAGPHLATMIGGLNGEGVIRLKGVDVKQGKTVTALAGALGLVSALNQFSGVLGGGAKRGSGLVDIAGSFAIRKGVASSQDIKVTSNLGDGAASGPVDLPRRYSTNWSGGSQSLVRGSHLLPHLSLMTTHSPGLRFPWWW